MAKKVKVGVGASAEKATPEHHPPTSDAKTLLAELAERLGETNVRTLTDGGLNIKIRGVIPTRCFAVDEAIGRGGVPRGRLTILHGGEGSGKTTQTIHLMAEVQAMGGLAVYIDAEYKLDPEYAASLGVNLDKMLYVEPETLEDALDAIHRVVAFAKAKRAQLAGKTYPLLVILDSINAATPKSVFEGDTGDYHMAPHARLYSQELPKICKAISKEDVALVFVSQYRKKLGLMFGDDAEIAGGNAPKHHASLILYYSRIGKLKDQKLGKGKDQIGSRTQVYVKKNQIAVPFRKGDFNIMYGRGIDREASLLESGVEHKLVELAGSWYSIDGERIGQGAEKAAQWLRNHRDAQNKLENDLRKGMGW